MNVDPRGLRLLAWLSTIVLAATLVTHSPWLAAAFLSAAFGFCLGCEPHLLIPRITTATPEGVTA